MTIASGSIRIYLPLEEWHAAPLENLDPVEIKELVRSNVAENPRREVGHETVLHFLGKALGFKDGWGGYKEAYPKIESFLRRNGLYRRENFFGGSGFQNDIDVCIARREAADRVFHGDGPRPNRIFLGHDGSPHICARHQYLYGVMPAVDLRDLDSDLKLVEEQPGELPRLAYKYKFMNMGFMNLIGDSLVDPARGRPVNQMYEPGKGLSTAHNSPQHMAAFGLFRRFIESSEGGWVQVLPLPFSENLVFLKGKDGTYDFLVKNMRVDLPPGEIDLGRVVAQEDVPTAVEKLARFPRWYYFHGAAWEAKDRMEAEDHYYAQGGKASRDYVGMHAILEAWYRHAGKYPESLARNVTCLDGFERFELADGSLFVSELISAGKYRCFLEQSGYAERRAEKDPPIIEDTDGDQYPAVVTWYDALSYCAWVERETRMPCRILTAREYHELVAQNPQEGPHITESTGRMEPVKVPGAEGFSVVECKQVGDRMEIVEHEGAVPRPMPLPAWPDVSWGTSPKGLWVVMDESFVEWVLAIDGLKLRGTSSQIMWWDDVLTYLEKDDTGKRKGWRTGFRVCYT